MSRHPSEYEVAVAQQSAVAAAEKADEAEGGRSRLGAITVLLVLLVMALLVAAVLMWERTELRAAIESAEAKVHAADALLQAHLREMAGGECGWPTG